MVACRQIAGPMDFDLQGALGTRLQRELVTSQVLQSPLRRKQSETVASVPFLIAPVDQRQLETGRPIRPMSSHGSTMIRRFTEFPFSWT